MHALSAWFTRNPVAANLLMALVVISGLFTLQSIRIEGFPTLPPSSISITTIYPGASAEQVDRGVTLKIEKALEGMPEVKRIISSSEEGISIVTVQKTSGFDMDRFHDEIKTRIDGIATFPAKAERPIITRDEFTVEALVVQVYGADDTATIQKVARLVKEELQSHPKISKITTFGLRPYEIRIELNDDRMRYFGLSLRDVAQAVESNSLDYRTGTIKSEAGKIIVRADRKALMPEEYASIPVKALPEGSRVLVRDVAQVIDGFDEDGLFARFNGKPSVGIQIYTSKKGHLLEVSEAVHEIAERLAAQLPDGMKIEIWAEYGPYMKERLSLLATNAWQGLLIVFFLLAVFLRVKLAFWVAAGIPVSIAATLSVMGDRFLGYSLNDLTTFGMIVVLGILVDDAIVVGESVFETRKKVADPVDGTIQGVHRVATATTFGAFTTVAAFYPLLLIDTDIGKIFASFAVVVIVAVLASLVESKLILPAHLAGISTLETGPRTWPERFWRQVQEYAGKALHFVNTKYYQPLLRIALQHRYATLVLFVTIAVCTAALPLNGWLRTVFFPEVPGQIIMVNLHMRSGSPLTLTMKNLERIEQAAARVNHEIAQKLGVEKPQIERVLVALTDPHEALVVAELQPEKDRAVETLEILRRWRDKVGKLEGADELSFSATYETGGGFAVELQSRDLSTLREATARFAAALSNIEGVHDVRDDLRQGSPQVRLILKPEAHHLGLTIVDLATQVGDAFGGLEVQRILREADEVRVYVKREAAKRRYLEDLYHSMIQTESGKWVPLAMVATVHTEYVSSSINRRNGHRVVQVRASLDKTIISPSELWSRLKKEVVPELEAAYPGLIIRGAGELEEIGEVQAGMRRALIMILILIYALLAVPLKSYWQPFVIMSVIPFGFVGAVLGHWINEVPLSVLSFFGMLAVMGVVVNDSLVMLTRFNQLREEGYSFHDALVQAGGSRFRAIFLTTVTTVCGLTPLLLETSEQAQYLIPAAISLAWGELVATPITLFIVPVLIVIATDLARFAKMAGQILSLRSTYHEK